MLESKESSAWHIKGKWMNTESRGKKKNIEHSSYGLERNQIKGKLREYVDMNQAVMYM